MKRVRNHWLTMCDNSYSSFSKCATSRGSFSRTISLNTATSDCSNVNIHVIIMARARSAYPRADHIQGEVFGQEVLYNTREEPEGRLLVHQQQEEATDEVHRLHSNEELYRMRWRQRDRDMLSRNIPG